MSNNKSKLKKYQLKLNHYAMMGGGNLEDTQKFFVGDTVQINNKPVKIKNVMYSYELEDDFGIVSQKTLLKLSQDQNFKNKISTKNFEVGDKVLFFYNPIVIYNNIKYQMNAINVGFIESKKNTEYYDISFEHNDMNPNQQKIHNVHRNNIMDFTKLSRYFSNNPQYNEKSFKVGDLIYFRSMMFINENIGANFFVLGKIKEIKCIDCKDDYDGKKYFYTINIYNGIQKELNLKYYNDFSLSTIYSIDVKHGINTESSIIRNTYSDFILAKDLLV